MAISGRDRGMATAELAVALPAVALVIVSGMTAVSVLTAQLRCVDAAREGARAAARGEAPAVVRAAVVSTGPDGAQSSVAGDARSVTVTVSAKSGPGGVLPSFRVSASAVALREPEAGDEP
jgi:TadE-like protein